MNYKWLKRVAEISDDYTSIIFHSSFNQKIEPNTLPENLTNLTFGSDFNQKIEPNTLPKLLTTLTFGFYFNQKIEPNTLPENLTTLNFGGCFNQKIDSENLPANLNNINFDWLYVDDYQSKQYIEMVNNIPNYYHVVLFLDGHIFGDSGPKWPIHVVDYKECGWSPDIYVIQNEYIHQIHGPITVLTNKKTYQPYSLAKSARK